MAKPKKSESKRVRSAPKPSGVSRPKKGKESQSRILTAEGWKRAKLRELNKA